MAKFTEEELKELLKNQANATPKAKRKYKLTKPRVYKERECARSACKIQFPPATASSRYCSPECKAIVKRGHARARKRGERGPTGATRGMLPPLDDGKGTVQECPDCGAAYDPTATVSRDSNVRQFTEMEHGVGYDYFECFCKPSHTFARYK